MNVSKWLVALAVLAVPALGAAQFDTGQNAAPPQRVNAWEEFKLDEKKTIQLSFRNASVDAVIEVFSKASGVIIVKDPTLNDKITVTSPKAVSLKTAFSILNAAISLRGYEMEKSGEILLIKKRPERRSSSEMSPEAMAAMMGSRTSRTELRVYRIEYANASEVTRVVNEVFAQREEQNNPFAAMFGGRSSRGSSSRFGRSSSFSFGGSRGGSSGGSTVKASSDDFSNSVIVNAPKEQQIEVEALIEEIDQQTEQPQSAKVYPLEYAIASELAPTVQNVLTSNAPTGRGGQGNQSVPLSQRFSQAARFGSFQSAFGTVVADDRTNTLIVTATSENHAMVASVINDLDQPVEIMETTFVFPLTNAKADEISDILNQTFGGRTTGNSSRNTNNQNSSSRNSSGRNSGRNSGGSGFGRAPQTDEEMFLQMADEEGIDGELATDIYAQFRMGGSSRQRGGGFGGFGGFGGGGSQSGASLQRGPDGRLVNTRMLDGQVQVIPDQNTNSLIIVTSPENVELLQQIIDQLDRLPEQVMIETMIVEATLDESDKLGVEWDYVQEKVLGDSTAVGNIGTDFGLEGGTTPPQGFKYTLTSDRLNTFINALKIDDKFQVLSTPRIFTSNNVEAEINISQSIPYVLSTREDNNGNLTFNYAFEDVGIILTVTPRITANGYVTLDVIQTANDLQGFTDFNAPIVNQRQAETTVSVKDGESVILGGIMRSIVTSKVKKLPLLGDIPLLGELFTSRERSKTKTELLVFLTPRIVRDNDDAQALREETENQLNRPVKDQIDKYRSEKLNKAGSGKSDKDN
jgi:general secretion pathway protein D